LNPALLIALAVLGLAGCADRSLRPVAASGTAGSDGGGVSGAAAPGAPPPGAPIPRTTTGSGASGVPRIDGAAETADASESLRRFVAAAMHMLGEPYRRGGSAPGGFDCSGLVAYAGRQIGLNFPRTARQQQRSGVPVARNALEPGDLVFMRLRGRQHHVGIMIDAIHFVHAPSSGGRVRIDSVDEKPYATRILAARRPDFPP